LGSRITRSAQRTLDLASTLTLQGRCTVLLGAAFASYSNALARQMLAADVDRTLVGTRAAALAGLAVVAGACPPARSGPADAPSDPRGPPAGF
jgi:hypothetical protein